MSKTFSVRTFNTAVSKYENKCGMKTQEKKAFRALMLYKCLVREINSKKGN